MAQVKGSMLVDFVKAIRSDKSGRFDKYFTEEDRNIISGLVLASNWYPVETYMNCFSAAVKEVAKGDMRMVWDWGRNFVDTTYREVYKHLFSETDPKRFLKTQQVMFKNLFDFVQMEMEDVSENAVIATMRGFDPLFEPFYQMVIGAVERMLEHIGVKGLEIAFLDKSWEGAPGTRVSLSWTR